MTQAGCPFLALIMPSDEGERQAQAMENTLQACASDEPFALELVGTKREQGFVLRASCEDQLTLLCKQLEAQYPQAEIKRLKDDPLLLRAGQHAAVGEFALSQPSYLPIKTFSGKALAEAGADPLAGLLASMESIGSGQKIIAQLALVRAKDSWLGADIRKSVEHALQPERDRQLAAMKNMTTSSDTAEGAKLVALLVAALAGMTAYRWYQAHNWFAIQFLIAGLVLGGLVFLWWKLFYQKKVPIYDTKLVAEKMARVGFYTQLRVIVIGKEGTSTKEELVSHIRAMEVVYRQFTLASANSLYLKRIRFVTASNQALTTAGSAFPYASFWLRTLHGGAYSWQVLNALELSGMYHLPQETADLPLVRRVTLKGLLASPEIAYQIEAQPLPPALFGYSEHRRFRVPVYLSFDALFSHKFFAGMSRSGKSVLIQLLTDAAMQPVAGVPQPGVFVADPHRDLIMDILKLVPPSRVNDVLLLDMTDTEYPVALNPLDASMGFTRDQAVSNLMSSFQRIWAEQWGPRMAYFLNSICLLLYTLNEQLVAEGKEDEQYTLLDINPILQYKDYAVQALSQLDMSETWHQELMVFWQKTYFNLNPNFKNEIIMPIISKIGVFNDNALLKRIVGQPVTKAAVHRAIRDGKIVLCALSARDMDENAVNILGSTLINLLHRSFGLQQHVELLERRKVFVAIDEFQNFSGSDFDKLLSEDAKYGCAMLLATQSLKRLNKIRDGLLEMVLANTQQLCVFRVSAADAKIMEEELAEKVTMKHIISLPPLHCYARLAIGGYPLQIVSVALAEPTSWKDDPQTDRVVETIRRISQAQARPKAEVDQLYADHLRQFLDVKAMASRIQREAKRANSEDQEDGPTASQQAKQVITGTKQATASSGDEAQAKQVITGTATASEDQEDGPSASLQAKQVITGTKQATASSSDEAQADEQKKPKKSSRSHPRSRRKGKQPVGVAPPEPSPLPGNGGAFAAGGTSWGGGAGHERRERGERG